MTEKCIKFLENLYEIYKKKIKNKNEFRKFI